MKNALLPSGFEDLLAPLAEHEARAIAAVMALFASYGYQRVKPPMAEFEDTMLGEGPGATLAQETFRVMDPVSHKMLALRSDITAQMARIAQLRLQDESRPLRLCYANDVIRTKAGQQRTLRQFAQVGAELIGVDTPDADAEIVVLALSALSALGVKGVSLDFGVPRLIDALFEAEKLDGQTCASFKAALKSRDEAGLDAAGHKGVAKTLKALLQAGGLAEDALKTLKKIKLPKPAAAQVTRLAALVEMVKAAQSELGLADMRLTIDPVETRGYDYHSGIAFTLFSREASGELGRGGYYLLPDGAAGGFAPACGFTLYMDALRQHIRFAEKKNILYIPKPQSWSLLKTLQQEGWVVVRGGMGEKAPPAGCTHIYKNGHIEEL